MWWLLASCMMASFVLSVAATACMRRWAMGWGFVDRPGGHKQHARETPLGGGIAITASLLVPLLGVLGGAALFGRVGIPSWLPKGVETHWAGVAAKTPAALGMIAGAVILHIMGLVDDVRPLSARLKLLVQVLVASGVVLGLGIRVMVHWGPIVSSVTTIVWIVGITNAFNLLDNMDGLAAGVACIAGLIFVTAAVQTGQIFVPAVTCMLVGAVGGFLCFNFPPASVFMGDCGSLVVGYMLAVLTVLTTFVDSQHGARPYGVLAPIMVLAVPMYDTFSVMWLRYRSGSGIMTSDRRHFSHRLVRRGMTTRSAVLTIYLATTATGLPATVLGYLDWPQAVLVLAQCVAVVLIIAILEQPPHHER